LQISSQLSVQHDRKKGAFSAAIPEMVTIVPGLQRQAIAPDKAARDGKRHLAAASSRPCLFEHSKGCPNVL
jgi:hypothetical protein